MDWTRSTGTPRRGNRPWTVLLLGHVLVAGCLPAGDPFGDPGPGDAFVAWDDATRTDLQTDPREVADGSSADVLPDAGIPPVHGPVFDPAASGFLSIPFPCDVRRTADGQPDLATFPNPMGVELIEAYLAAAAGVLDGFSIAPVVFFAFLDPLDVSGIPSWIPADAAQAFQWVDVSPGPARGRRVPLLWRWEPEETAYLPARVLALRPVPGATLVPGHSYAALVMTDLPAEPPLAAPPAFRDALDGRGPAGPSLAPLRDWLATEPGLAERVAVATVFTVGDPLADLRRIREALWQAPAPTPIRDVRLADSSGEWDLYDAEYDAPEFLRGEAPFASEGGGFDFDAAGRPVVQRTVTLRLALSVPKAGTMPEAGWPIALTSHGTGGDYHTFADTWQRDTATALALEGIAGTGIDQPLHGARSSPPLLPDLLDLYSFNFLNPEAGRTVQRQSVADTVHLLRLVREGKVAIPASVSRRGTEERFDPERVVFFGHSQGGITGALLFGVEDRLRGGVLSGAGGGLSTTIMVRKDPMDFEALVAAALSLDDPGELSEFHPVLALVQMMVDAVDPLAYAPHWREFDAGDPAAHPRSVLATEGVRDAYTPSATAEALAVAGGLPVLKPVASWSLGAEALGLEPIDSPVEGNLPGVGHPATGAQVQYPADGHFAVYQNGAAFQTYRRFLGSLVSGPGRIEVP